MPESILIAKLKELLDGAVGKAKCTGALCFQQCAPRNSVAANDGRFNVSEKKLFTRRSYSSAKSRAKSSETVRFSHIRRQKAKVPEMPRHLTTMRVPVELLINA
jgi:hypothetical protein